MKALEVLKQHRKNLISTCARVDVTYDNPELDEAIKELEELESIDRLAELEKVILDYYLDKGYQVSSGDWGFEVYISSKYKNKNIQVRFYDFTDEKMENDIIFIHHHLTTNIIFNKAFEFFQLKKENKDEKCKHRSKTTHYEYVSCNDCGSIFTDGSSSWGIAKNKWFNSELEAKFYKENGYLPK